MDKQIVEGVTDIHMYCIHNLCILADKHGLNRDGLIEMFWHLMRDMCIQGSYKNYILDYKNGDNNEYNT